MSVNIEINQIMTIGNDKSYIRNLDDIIDSLISQNIIDFRTAKIILDKIDDYSDENIDRYADKIDELEMENEEIRNEIDSLEDENYELRTKVDRLEKENSRLFKNYMSNLPGRLEYSPI